MTNGRKELKLEERVGYKKISTDRYHMLSRRNDNGGMHRIYRLEVYTPTFVISL